MKTFNPGPIFLLTSFAVQLLCSNEAKAWKETCPSYAPETILLELIDPKNKAEYLKLQKFYSPIKSISASKLKETEIRSDCYLKSASCRHEFRQAKSLQPTKDVSRNIELAKQTKFTRNIVSCEETPQSLVKPGTYIMRETLFNPPKSALEPSTKNANSEIEISPDRKTLIHRIQHFGKNVEVKYYVVKSEIEAPPTLIEYATLIARSRANEIRYCYEKFLQQNRTPGKKTSQAQFIWIIDDHGVAQNIKLNQLNVEGITQALKEQFETCAKSRMDKWPFKPSEKDKPYSVEHMFQL